MATYIQKVLALWQADDDDDALDRIRKMGITVGLGGAGVCAILFLNLLAFSMLNTAWLDGNWHSYWLFAVGPFRFEILFPFLSIASSWTATRLRQQPPARRVRELRQAALRGDDDLAPIVQDGPEPFAEVELPAAVEVIPRLRPLILARSNLMLSAGGFAIIFAAFLTLCAVFSVVFGWSDIALAGKYGDPYGMLLVVCFAAFIAAIAALFIYGWVLIRRAPLGHGRIPRRRRRIDAVVDPWGVRWIFPARPLEEQRIAWEDARAFYQISYRSYADYARHTTYFLDAGDTLLAWKMVSTEWDELLAYNERFLRIITTQTGLPLRDLSDAAEEVGKSIVYPKKMTREERAAAARAVREARRNRPRQRPSVALVASCVGALALFLLPALVGLRVQAIQRNYYNGIEARVLAQHPIFTDSLVRPDSGGPWLINGLPPAKAPSNGHDPSDSYQGGAYQITGGPAQWTVDATPPMVYGDAAVQVTVRQRGNKGYDGVGLVVREVGSGNAEGFVAFWVRPNGEWSLERSYSDAAHPNGTWEWLAGSSGDTPVHTGLGAANTVLVVMRGNEFICYVNGEWVAAAHDSAAPASGKVGVFLDDGANTGIYSDFAVYPAA